MNGKRMAIAALTMLMIMGQLTGCASNTEQEVKEISEQENVEMEVSDSIEEETISSEETMQDTVETENEEISNENINDVEYFNGSDSIEEEVPELPYEQKEADASNKPELLEGDISFCKEKLGLTDEEIEALTEEKYKALLDEYFDNLYSSIKNSSSSSSSSSSEEEVGSMPEDYFDPDMMPELPDDWENVPDVPAGRME